MLKHQTRGFTFLLSKPFNNSLLDLSHPRGHARYLNNLSNIDHLLNKIMDSPVASLILCISRHADNPYIRSDMHRDRIDKDNHVDQMINTATIDS